MGMPLEGIRVLDWTAFQQGPTATCMLADLGAEVIHIEQPQGDPARGLLTLMGVSVPMNFYFQSHNRGKKSMMLDLRKEKGREIVHKLVEKSDIFATNFLYDAARKLKMDYETLVQYNPKLIYAYSSGWGSKGPDAYKESFDLVGQARGGIMSVTRAEDGTPTPVGGGFADEMGGVMTAYGIMIALFVRERTGEGQFVEASLLSGVIEAERLALQAYLMAGHRLDLLSNIKSTANPLWGMYKCNDGKWIACGMLQPDKKWSGFCKGLKIEYLEKDPRFENSQVRTLHTEELLPVIKEKFSSKSRDEWVEILSAQDCIVTPVNELPEVAKDPQVLANDYIVEVDDPRYGKVKVPGIPVQLSKTPGKVRAFAPELGQHTEEILIEVLGYTWDDIAKLREENVF
jgi:crotonobetainyl-CoA:carnitine CoA-transferase CaiB-like acyl-CoA transferase